MKTQILFSIMVLGFLLNAFGQKPALELTFTAQSNGHHISLDSIFVENLTQGVDTALYAPDTILVLEYATNIDNKKTIEKNNFSVSQNYPNPFDGLTEVHLYLPERDDIKITIRDFLGRELANYENTLNQGNHDFTFYLGNEKYYLLTIIDRHKSQTIKMLNAGTHVANGEKYKIDYTGNSGKVSYFKSQNTINDFEFNLGDELKFTAYALTAIGNLGSSVLFENPEMNAIYEFDVIEGLRCPGMPIITDIDGNSYNTVQIGNQCWMKENLRTTTYKNGIDIPNVTDANDWYNLTTAAYAWYDNDSSWKDIYGAYYNGYAVINDTNGLCPDGWHVPNDDEWTELSDFIGGNVSPFGNELKACRQVNSPLGENCNVYDHPRWSQHFEHYGLDVYGFTAFPAGSRGVGGIFGPLGTYGVWWSSTESYPGKAWYRNLGYDFGSFYRSSGIAKIGGSIRCLKD